MSNISLVGEDLVKNYIHSTKKLLKRLLCLKTSAGFARSFFIFAYTDSSFIFAYPAFLELRLQPTLPPDPDH